MTAPNPFESLGGAFAQQPAAPAAPAPAPAPAPETAPAAGFPQAPAAPAAPATGFPQTAPAANQAPVQLAPTITASPNAPTPATAGVAAFGTSRDSVEGEKHKIRDDLGRPLLFRIHEVRMMEGKNGSAPYEAVFADWIVLDPAAPALRERGMITNRPIVRDLKDSLNQGLKFHVGRVKEVPSQHPQPALALGALTEEEKAYAQQAGAALGWW